MSNKKIISGALLVMLLISTSAFSNNLQQLQREYNTIQRAVNDPNVLIVYLHEIDEDPVPRFMTWEQIRENFMEWLISRQQYTPERHAGMIAYAAEMSKVVKKRMKSKVLPQLKNKILAMGGAVELPINRQNKPKKIRQNQVSNFDRGWNSTDGYTASWNASSGNATAISSSNTSSFDQGWNNQATAPYYGKSCPKHNPGNRSSFKIYPNGQNSGKTYIKCGYFSDGKINYEKHYVNRKLHGKSIIWSNLNGIHYVSERSNYKMNKLHGIKDDYMQLRSGAVIRYSMITYADGKKHGDSASWHENGRPKSDCTNFQGKTLRCNEYKKDGSFAYCTDYQRDGRPRDCRTGRRR